MLRKLFPFFGLPRSIVLGPGGGRAAGPPRRSWKGAWYRRSSPSTAAPSAAAAGPVGGSPDVAQVSQLLNEARNAFWTETEAVGEGQEYRTEFGGKVGSALLLDGALVHGSVVAGVS
jgi:hypothetical protein